MFSRKLVLVTTALFLVFGCAHNVWADDDDDDNGHGNGNGNGNSKKKDSSDPTGAWFGIARACPANPVTDSAAHAAFCTAVCGACPNAFVLPAEIVMMPTLGADGTLLADDAGQIGVTGTALNYHTPAHGVWTTSDKDGLPDRPGTDRLKGTFLWLGTGTLFSNAVRTRFVTYFDPKDPDRMLGFIQPYMFPLAVAGLVLVNPPPDQTSGNHIPTIDPLVTLPAGCAVPSGCLGTYHFVIRRIKAQ